MTKADIAHAIYEGLARPIEIRRNNKVETITTAAAIAQRQIHKALDGDSKAAAFLMSKALEVAPHQAITKIIHEIITPRLYESDE